MRILILEDNLDAAETLALLLNMDGHETVQVSDGEEALNKIRNEEFDGAIIDLMTSGKMNGWEFLDKMDAGGKKVHVIVASGYADIEPPSIRHHVPLLRKPYDPKALLDLVNKNFGKPI